MFFVGFFFVSTSLLNTDNYLLSQNRKSSIAEHLNKFQDVEVVNELRLKLKIIAFD